MLKTTLVPSASSDAYLGTHFGTQKWAWPCRGAPMQAGGAGKAPAMPGSSKAHTQPQAQPWHHERRSPCSPRLARSPSSTFTKGERCQEVFFPSCTKLGWGGRCCYCAFFFFFFFFLMNPSHSIISTEQPFHLRGTRATPVKRGV